MEQIDYELKILTLEQRNEFLSTEYRWIWQKYCELRKEIMMFEKFSDFGGKTK